MRDRLRSFASACTAVCIAGALLVLGGPASAACHIAAFSSEAYDVAEGDGTVRLTVTLLGGQPGCEGSVRYATEDGSARAGEDFESSSGELRFSAGDDREETIEIAITDDDAGESDESFRVVLSGGTGDISADDEATVTISDDDQAASSPSETPSTDPTTDPTVTGDTEDDSSAAPMIAIIVAVLVAVGVAGALLARKGRAAP